MYANVRKEKTSVSNGIIASIPKSKENGVSPIVVLEIVQYDHSTLGSSSAYPPLSASSFAFNVCLTIVLITSTWPLACGWFNIEKCFFFNLESLAKIHEMSIMELLFVVSHYGIRCSKPTYDRYPHKVSGFMLSDLRKGSTSAHLLK